jgi:trk system potassium uptake protein TrkA
MNIVVIGLGEVGKHIASVLSKEDHNVTIVDADANAIAVIEDRLDVRSVVGRAGSAKIMKEIEIEKSDLVISVTNLDEVNIFTALIAKKLGANKAIARVDSREYLPETQGSFQELFGIDLVISPEILSAIEISKLIGHMGATFIAEFADGKVELMQLVHKKKAGITGVPLQKLNTPPDLLLSGIIRNNELIIPSGGTVLKDGDKVFIIGKKESIEEGSRYFGRSKETGAEKVVVLGGGEIGFSVAKLLEAMDISVVLIEWNEERCKFLSEELNEALIINGDGTDIELLKQEKVGESDVFVTASKRDEVNLMSGLLAKELGSKKIIAIVHRPDYLPVYEHLGLDATISPRRFAANKILKYARSGDVVSVSDIDLGKGEILEFNALDNSEIVNTPLKNLEVPDGAIIGAIASEKDVIIPTGDDMINPGDRVIVFTIPGVRSEVENLFKSK